MCCINKQNRARLSPSVCRHELCGEEEASGVTLGTVMSSDSSWYQIRIKERFIGGSSLYQL